MTCLLTSLLHIIRYVHILIVSDLFRKDFFKKGFIRNHIRNSKYLAGFSGYIDYLVRSAGKRNVFRIRLRTKIVSESDYLRIRTMKLNIQFIIFAFYIRIR